MKKNYALGEKTDISQKKVIEKEVIKKEVEKRVKSIEKNKKIEFNDMIKSYSFEQASKELDEVISKLEIGNLNLEDSIKLYEKGALLIEHCNNSLNKLTGVITIIKDKIEKSFEVKNKKNDTL